MSKKPFFGPDNPHPLSTLSTELVWEGKYDEYGNRREVDIAGCAMPMQKIETIDEPRREAIAEGKLALFDQQMRTKRTDELTVDGEIPNSESLRSASILSILLIEYPLYNKSLIFSK